MAKTNLSHQITYHTVLKWYHKLLYKSCLLLDVLKKDHATFLSILFSCKLTFSSFDVVELLGANVTMLGREFSWFARVSLLQRGHQCNSENGIRWFDRTADVHNPTRRLCGHD